MNPSQILKLIIGIVIFGVLMGLRSEFEQTWVRMPVSGFAGGVLGWALLQAKASKG